MSSDSVRGEVAVLGIGNPLMGDEGVGVAVVRGLMGRVEEFEGVDFVDAGTGGVSILHVLANRRKVIFVDCAYMGTPPGTMRKFGLDDVESIKQLAHQSLHEADLIAVVKLSEQLGACPDEVVFFGIEPARIQPGEGLSDAVAAGMDEYATAVLAEAGA